MPRSCTFAQGPSLELPRELSYLASDYAGHHVEKSREAKPLPTAGISTFDVFNDVWVYNRRETRQAMLARLTSELKQASGWQKIAKHVGTEHWEWRRNDIKYVLSVKDEPRGCKVFICQAEPPREVRR